MKAELPSPRQAGNRVIADHATSEVRSFFDQIKNGTTGYRTIASLDAQVAQEYRGRCVLELLQNAHDALAERKPNDPGRISFVLQTSPEPVLLIGNTGRPFHHDDFKGICQLAQSPKDPNKSVGNKGLGFRSVLEVSGCPEIWSTSALDSKESFSFRFDPNVIDRVIAAAQDLVDPCRLDVPPSPFDTESLLVDWSREQLRQFRRSVAEREVDILGEAMSLSPYTLPLPMEATPPDVQRLLDSGHATVVRLRLDGGRMRSSEGALESVRKQLDELRGARSVVFLDHLAELVIEVEGDRRSFERIVCSDERIAGHPRIRQRQIRVQSTGTSPHDASLHDFRVWTRVVGGTDDPEGTEHIRSAVEHLPNQWPEVRQATIGVAVEDTPDRVEGVFVIFLPTEKVTGTGAHINAPFYGSLDRRQIDFGEQYNKLILDAVLDLCLDLITELAGGNAGWCARAVMDIVASVASVGGESHLTSKLCEHAEERGAPLDDQALILCDRGWRTPKEARLMPDVGNDDPVGLERWREQAAFSVVSEVLDGRRMAVMHLLTNLGGSEDPTQPEWINTVGGWRGRSRRASRTSHGTISCAACWKSCPRICGTSREASLTHLQMLAFFPLPMGAWSPRRGRRSYSSGPCRASTTCPSPLTKICQRTSKVTSRFCTQTCRYMKAQIAATRKSRGFLVVETVGSSRRTGAKISSGASSSLRCRLCRFSTEAKKRGIVRKPWNGRSGSWAASRQIPCCRSLDSYRSVATTAGCP